MSDTFAGPIRTQRALHSSFGDREPHAPDLRPASSPDTSLRHVPFVLGAAWFVDGSLLVQRWGLIRLAIPAAVAMAGLVIDDAYRNPKRRGFSRAPFLGIAITFIIWFDSQIPLLVLLCGAGMSLLPSSAVRLLFPPTADQFQGANAPAYWLERPSGPSVEPLLLIRILKVIAAVVVLAVLIACLATLRGELR